MKILRILLALLVIAGVYACTQIEYAVDKNAPIDAPVSIDMYRTGGDLNIELIIPKSGWDYTSVLSNDGLTYTLVLKDLDRAMGEILDINIIRPITKIERTQYPSGIKLVFHLVNPHVLSTSKNDLGLHVTLTSTSPDMEMVSMKTFGGWADPQNPASTFQGIHDKDGKTTITFDGPVVYSSGKAGGRHYVDIFGVNLLPGIVKHKGLMASNNMNNKTRLIFKNMVKLCPESNRLTIGEGCKGYSSLAGFKREKNDKTESFQFDLPGRPEMSIREMDGLVAFGFKNTRLFSKVLQRYSDGDVYKVEAREKDGILWLVFLYENNLKYRKYYSGDKFFVVFYR